MNNILDSYAQHLFSNNLSKTTVKNYISDVRQFLIWKETVSPHSIISTSLVDQYVRSTSFTKSIHTTFRKSASLHKFSKWANQTPIEISKSKKQRRNLHFPTILLLVLLVLLPLAFERPKVKTPDVGENENATYLSLNKNIPSKVNGEMPTTFNTSSRPIEIAVSGYETNNVESDNDVVLSLESEMKESSSEDDLRLLSPIGGKEKIEKGNTNTFILNESINENTIITVTPTTPTFGKTIYIKSQGNGFVVMGIDEAVDEDIEINWIAI